MAGIETYEYTTDRVNKSYSFLSIGPRGIIPKLAKFTTLNADTFNVGFSDYDQEKSSFSDTHVSDNKDTRIIMGTIGSIIDDFTSAFQSACIYFEGSSPARTRLYQINISKYWALIDLSFEVLGMRNNRWERFRKGVNYTAFMGRRKKSAMDLFSQLYNADNNTN